MGLKRSSNMRKNEIVNDIDFIEIMKFNNSVKSSLDQFLPTFRRIDRMKSIFFLQKSLNFKENSFFQ